MKYILAIIASMMMMGCGTSAAPAPIIAEDANPPAITDHVNANGGIHAVSDQQWLPFPYQLWKNDWKDH